MAEIIRLRKGLDIKLLGAPAKSHSQAGRQGTADRQGR